MARIKLALPETFSFTTTLPVRITDLNYGGHVGNDTILTLLHEARVQYLKNLGYSELDLAGVSLIMADVAIEFKAELFYGDALQAAVTAAEFTRAGFELYYKLFVPKEEKEVTIALAKTGMVCFNYNTRKVTAIPQEAMDKMKN